MKSLRKPLLKIKYSMLNKHNVLFYFVLLLGLIGLLYTNPFLRYPYDMIHHLIVIDDIYIQLISPTQTFTGIWAENVYIIIPTGEYKPLELASPRYLWHYIWSELFVSLSIVLYIVYSLLPFL